MSKKIYITIVVLALMALSFFGGNWTKGLKCISVAEDGFSKLTNSSLIQSWTATIYGEITSISDRNILLVLAEKNLEVPIKDSASISEVSFVGPVVEGETTEFETKNIQFEDLAVGQKVSIIAEVAKDGTMQGINVTVIKEAAVK